MDRLGARRARRAAARVHEAADRAARDAPRLPPRRLPHRRGAARLGRARRVVVPAGRAEDDAAQLARRRRAHARRLPERQRDPDADPAGRARDRRHLPDPLQRLGGPIDFTLPAVSFGRRWTHELSTAEPRPRRARRSTRRAASSRSRAARSSCCAGSARWRELRATYRLQLGPELGFREARGLVPYLRDLGVSHLYLSPSLQARAGSTHGYDVVDPTRDLGGPRRRGRSSARSPRPRGRARPRARHRPEPHGGERREPVLARSALAREVLRPRLAHRLAPPLLRRQRARRRADGGSRGLGGDARQGASSSRATGLVDGVRIDHPDGLANPRRYLERLREAGIERVWVEKILEPGERLRPEWPVEGTTGYEFLNDVTALFVDPAGEEPLTRLYEELTGERRPFGEVAAEAKLEQARTTFARGGGAAGCAAAVRRRRRAGARVLPRLPHLRRAGRGARHREDRAAIEAPGCRTSSRGSCCSRSAATTRSSSASSRRRRRCTRRASRTRRSTAGTASSR